MGEMMLYIWMDYKVGVFSVHTWADGSCSSWWGFDMFAFKWDAVVVL